MEGLVAEVFNLLTIALDDELSRLHDDFADMQDIGTEKRVIDACDKSVREIADALRRLM